MIATRNTGERGDAMHDARNVANQFIQRGIDRDHPFTPLQIQKLTYFAHAWTLGIYGRSLIDDVYEAWKYGPVLPVIYWNLSHYKGRPVDACIPIHPDDEREFSDADMTTIQQVHDLYGHLSGWSLSKLTHAPGTPWSQIHNVHGWYIPNDLIQRYYANLIKEHGKRS